MYFDNLAAAIAMEGHGAYVWSAYFIAIVVVGMILILPRTRSRKLLRGLAGEVRRSEAQAAAATDSSTEKR